MWHRANVAMSLIRIYLFVMFYSSRLLFDFRNRKSKDQTPTRFMSYVVVACPRSWKKRTCSLFNDDQPSSLINMLASSSFKRFFHSRKSEEVRLCWTRNHIRLPLVREKVKRGAITENKQKDLTNSSSTLLVDEEAENIERGEQQVKIEAMQTALYPKKNYSSFHSVLIIFFELVEITLSVIHSKNKIFNKNRKR